MNFKIKSAHSFVNKQQKRGIDFRWDGWDIVLFKPREVAVYSRNGVFRNGQWGYETRFVVDDGGEWNIDKRYLNLRSPRGRA